MTTSLINHPQTYTIPDTKQSATYTSQDVSPASSASPTSPRINEYLPHYAPNPAKQLRPMQKPLYVPAVLRPNDYYPQASPNNPKILHGSLDSLQEHEREEAYAVHSELDMALQQQQFSREEELGEVTGPPTKEHWKPDEASPNCDSPKCRSSFNLFIRKHHCRHCGHIFCSSHAQHTIPLDQSARFHPSGIQSRACEACHKQYQRWDTARSFRRKNSDNVSSSSGSSEEDATSGVQSPSAESRRLGHQRAPSSSVGIRHDQQPQQPIANSVPKDWAWSTF